MTDGWLVLLTFVTALGCGLMAGVFFAFSTFVMGALGRLPPWHGVAAMQSINVAAVTPPFMLALFGTGLASAVVAATFTRWPGHAAPCVLAGGVLYLLGTIGVTIVFNVPRNNALAAVDGASAEGAAAWEEYLRSWTAWNHVRTLTALAAAVLLTLALVLGPGGAG